MAERWPYASSAVSSSSEAAGGGGAGAEMESFLAGSAGSFGPVAVVRAAAVAAAAGRTLGGLVEAARETRGARVVAVSAAGRVVEGRFAVAVAVAAAVDESEDLDTGFPGDGRAAVVDETGGLRTAGFFLLSSPDVTDERSGSASEAVLDDEMVLRAVVPDVGRVGGLLRLDPTVLVRGAAAAGGFAALVVVRVVVEVVVAGAGGRRAPAAVALVTVGRRGAAASLAAGEGAWEAILRLTDDVGVEGAGSFFGCGLPAARLSGAVFSIGERTGCRSGGRH
jgi:hypothetical protein